MKIIAALNGVITSEIAALYALNYAEINGLPLVLLHVHNTKDSLEEVESSMSFIERTAREKGCRTERIFLKGDPCAAIKAFLHEVRADTLFCSTRTQHRFFEDSLSEELAALDLPVDLAVVRTVHVDHISSVESVVLPVLESRLSVRKFVFFASLSRMCHASGEIYSVTVAGRNRMAALEMGETKRLFQKINERMAHYLKLGRFMEIPMRIKHALAANEVDEVLQYTAENNFQLMVVGGSRHSRFSRLFGEKPIERLFRATSVNTIAFYDRYEK